MMNRIMDTQHTVETVTAKELIKQLGSIMNTEELMTEFARMHVRKALTAAHYAAVSELDGRAWDTVYNKKFLLQCYPEGMVK
jgi:hypothetical protein